MRQTAMDFDAFAEPWWLLRPHGYDGGPGEGILVQAESECEAIWQAGYARSELAGVERAEP